MGFRQAQVKVINKTGKKLLSVAVVHKYSDEKPTYDTWKLVNVNETTSKSFVVRYKAGFGAWTTADWWFVIWINQDGDVYITSPENLPALMSKLRNILNIGSDPLLASLANYVTEKSPEPNSEVIEAADNFTKVLAQRILENNTKEGYKKHSLTKKDENKDTDIIISNEQVKFESPSGKSETGVEKVKSSKSSAKNTLRPVYLIAHRCNDPKTIETAIKSGCNAVECDLNYDKFISSNKEKVYVDHEGAPTTTLTEWLEKAKIVAIQEPEKFALIVFDMKFATGNDHSAKVVKIVRDEIRSILPKDNCLNIVFSIGEYNDRAAFDNIIGDLQSNEGVSIDYSNNPERVEEYFSSRNVKNIWYGNGINAALPDPGLFIPGKSIFTSIKKGTELRDNNKKIKKVYVWTLARESSIRQYFNEAKVDGVMINVRETQKYFGADIASVFLAGGLQGGLKTINDSNIRLAKRSDNAFDVF